jgi:hypothetical protein
MGTQAIGGRAQRNRFAIACALTEGNGRKQQKREIKKFLHALLSAGKILEYCLYKSPVTI